jgi:hypothetical protein
MKVFLNVPTHRLNLKWVVIILRLRKMVFGTPCFRVNLFVPGRYFGRRQVAGYGSFIRII